MNFELRPYQKQTVENFKLWWQANEKLATIILPTGVGKTKTATACLATLDSKKILWVAHRKELIEQAFLELSSILDNVYIEMEKNKASAAAKAVVGSVQTLARKRQNLEGFIPDIIIIDEYHHFAEENVQYQGLLDRWPDARVLGLTATPWRFSGENLPLGNILYNMDIGTAVKNNYLVPPVPQTIFSNTSLAKVSSRMGDFEMKSLSAAVNSQERNFLIKNKINELVASGRQGIVFAVDVEHSKTLASLMDPHIRYAQAYADTPTKEREHIIDSLRKKQIDVLFNNTIYVEGFDVPHLSFVIVARPTKSLGLYIQCVGRGLRLSENKKDCLIIDICDKVKVKQNRILFDDFSKHGDLYGEKKRAGKVLDATIEHDPLSKTIKYFPVMLSKHDRWIIDEETWPVCSWKMGEYHWIIAWSSTDKGLSGPKDEKLFYICKNDQKFRVISLLKKHASLILKSDSILDLYKTNEYLEDEARNDRIFPLVKAGAKWRTEQATDRQIYFVQNLVKQKKIGIDIDMNDLSKGEVSSLIEQFKWHDAIYHYLMDDNIERLIGA